MSSMRTSWKRWLAKSRAAASSMRSGKKGVLVRTKKSPLSMLTQDHGSAILILTGQSGIISALPCQAKAYLLAVECPPMTALSPPRSNLILLRRNVDGIARDANTGPASHQWVTHPPLRWVTDCHFGRPTKVGIAVGVLLMASLMTGCGKHGKAAPSGGSDIPPSKVSLKRNVELARVEQRPLVYYVETVGRIEAEGETGIAAGVTGIVDEVLFREGQQVDRNTILVKVDQRRYKAAADVTRANEKRAERNVKLKKDLANRAQFGRGGVSEQDKTQTLLDFQLAEA